MSDLNIDDPDRFSAYEKSRWQRAADLYHVYFGPLTSQIAEQLIALVKPPEPHNCSILDIATGPGYLAREALQTEAFSRAVGIDFSAAMIEIAKQGSASARYTPEFFEGDAEDLNFPDASFDAVAMNFGMLHMGRPTVVINEAHRVLKPGGKFGFSAWVPPEKSLGFAIILAAIEAFADKDVAIPAGPPFFYFGDRKNCAVALEAVGFNALSFREINTVWVLNQAEDLFDAFVRGSARTGGLLRLQTADTLDKIKKSVVKDCKQCMVHGKLSIPMGVLLTVGTKSLTTEQ